MPILEEIPFSPSETLLFRSIGNHGEHEALAPAVRRALQLIRETARPLASYEIIPVQSTEGGKLYLEREPVIPLSIGPHIDLIAKAQQVFVYIVTLGQGPEAKVEELFDTGQALEGYLLDLAATISLGLATDHLSRMVEAYAAQKGWGVSRRLSPGSLAGWPLRDQRNIARLAQGERIGVQLTSGYLLMPRKSVTGLIGVGPHYTERQVGSVCYLCRLRETCWRRRT